VEPTIISAPPGHTARSTARAARIALLLAIIITLVVPAPSRAQGTLGERYTPEFNATVWSLAYQPGNQKILVGGDFTELDGSPVGHLVRLDDSGVDTTFRGTVNGSVLALAVQSDGKILVGGSFTRAGAGSVDRHGLVRLASDGTVDATFAPVLTLGTGEDPTVTRILVQADGAIIVGGRFDHVNGTSRNFIGRLNANGTLDTMFAKNNPLLDAVGALCTIGNGDVVAGCRASVLRFGASDPLAQVMTTVTAQQEAVVEALAPQGDGLLVAGRFSSIGSIQRAGIARVTSGGLVDVTYDPRIVSGSYDRVLSIATTTDGPTVVGGLFTTPGPVSRRNLVALDAKGAMTGWSPNPNGAVMAVLRLDSGRLIVAGEFTEIAGTARGRLAFFD